MHATTQARAQNLSTENNLRNTSSTMTVGSTSVAYFVLASDGCVWGYPHCMPMLMGDGDHWLHCIAEHAAWRPVFG